MVQCRSDNYSCSIPPLEIQLEESGFNIEVLFLRILGIPRHSFLRNLGRNLLVVNTKRKNMEKEKKFRITVSESQLRMIADCVEDCSRFMAGDLELHNCTSKLDSYCELHDELKKLQHYVTPHLSRGANYDWAGNHCPDEVQRKFIAASYYLYREIRHFDAIRRNVDNVYRGTTLRCADSGMPITIEEVKEE